MRAMLRAVRRAARSAASRANAEALTTRAMAIARGEDATRTVTVARTVTRAHATTAPTIPSKPSQPVQTKRPGKLPSDAAHTAKWLDSSAKPSPMEYSASAEPVGVPGDKVSCDSPGACKDRFGDATGGLGAPNTYYKLNDTSPESPAKCKYCGLRFYSLGGHH